MGVGMGQDVNSSYLNSLMEQARSVGVRTFHVPADLPPARAIAIVEEVVQKMGLTQIWHSGTVTHSEGYYGICDKQECGLLITNKEKLVEIRAGGGNKETITYLLTSISRDLRDRFEKEGHRGVNVSLTIQDSIIYKSSIPLGDNDRTVEVQDTWSKDEVLLSDASGSGQDAGWSTDDVTVVESDGKKIGDSSEPVPNY